MPLELKYDIELELRDKDGKLISKRVEKGHTWVKWILYLMYIQLAQTSLTVTKTSGSSTSQSTNAAIIKVASSYGDGTYGVVVGTSDLAYGIEQYSLDSQIAHGNASGQLLYGNTSVDDVAPMTNGFRFFVSRVFTNSSGASITVKEVGLYTSVLVMLCRDVLSVPVEVQNLQSLTVRYIISFTYA